MGPARLCGVGLHSGVQTTVTLTPRPGPTSFVQRGVRALMRELYVVRTDFGVSVSNQDRSLQVDLVEHFFAALAVLNAQDGIEVEIDGPEFPLLGGGASEWCEALETLGVEPRPATHSIARRARLTHGTSVYDFEPGAPTKLCVSVEFGQRLGRQSAGFAGDPAQFRREIAPARTFGFKRDAEHLRALGRATHVDPESVLVFNDDGSVALPSRPPEGNELAAHKLLDLVGDSLLYGGLPRGTLHADRPGHGPNHAVFAEALRTGIIVRHARV
jgi:UDP-3-O-[3-hydroxymyristoyl] N-acetylglucosamine deacetylase